MIGCIHADLEIKQGIRWIIRCSSSTCSRDSLVSHAMSCGFSGSHNFTRSQEVRNGGWSPWQVTQGQTSQKLEKYSYECVR